MGYTKDSSSPWLYLAMAKQKEILECATLRKDRLGWTFHLVIRIWKKIISNTHFDIFSQCKLRRKPIFCHLTSIFYVKNHLIFFIKKKKKNSIFEALFFSKNDAKFPMSHLEVSGKSNKKNLKLNSKQKCTPS